MATKTRRRSAALRRSSETKSSPAAPKKRTVRDPVVELAQQIGELGLLIKNYNSTSPEGPVGKECAQHRKTACECQRDALINLLTVTESRTLPGALCQVAFAASLVEDMCRTAPRDLEKVLRLLAFAMRAMESANGGLSWHALFRWQTPFRGVPYWPLPGKRELEDIAEAAA